MSWLRLSRGFVQATLHSYLSAICNATAELAFITENEQRCSVLDTRYFKDCFTKSPVIFSMGNNESGNLLNSGLQ